MKKRWMTQDHRACEAVILLLLVGLALGVRSQYRFKRFLLDETGRDSKECYLAPIE